LVAETVGALPNTEAGVTGLTAEWKDTQDQMKSKLPLVVGFVLLFAFSLMLVAFRSIVVAIKAIVLNLLSVAAAFGVLVLVFQHGFGKGLLGFSSTAGIAPVVPLLLFVILFGLSMDYHVFIISRIRETFDRGASMDDAITHGIKTTAGVVTSAAIVVVAVFSIFATLSMLMFKQFGVGLAAAILIDATIVRGVLLPATMKLLGERNWYLPAGSSGCRASSTRSRRRRRPRRRTRLPLQRSPLHGSRPRIDAAGTGWPCYEVGSGLMIPNVAPCGSRSTARRPTLGTSIGSMTVSPPSSVAFAVVASGSSTAT
jgi:predicted RND superfamily exporter protein